MVEPDLDFDYYIYTCFDRIARIVKTKRPYNLVRYGGVKTYSTNYIPSIPISELLFTYNYSRSKANGFYIPEGNIDNEILHKLKLLNVKIQIMEKFEAASNVLKNTIIKRTADEDIFNRILMQQIDEFECEGKVGSLLKAELECSKFESLRALIEAYKLKYSDASEILAFVRYKTRDINDYLLEDNFDAAEDLIKEIYQKYAL